MNKEENKSYIYIDRADKVDDVIKSYVTANVLAIDTETTGLNPHTAKLRLIQIAADDMPTVIFDCFKVFPQAKQAIKKILENDSVKVFQNAKFDLQFLKSEGIYVQGPLFDTMLASQILRTSGGPKRAGLNAIAQHYLGIDLPKEEQTSDFSGELTESQLDYAAKDAEILLQLRNIMVRFIKENGLIEVARLEFACCYAIADVEYNGIYLDTEKWQGLTEKTEKLKQQALDELYPYVGYPKVQMNFLGEEVESGINLDSNKQVLSVLNKNGVNVSNTSKHSLAPFSDNPIVLSITKYRHATKALTGFLYPLPSMICKKTGRLHPRYMQMGAGSGRMSCGEPNIQQIPRDKEFRSCFCAPKGRKMIIADYSQIELRVIAQISGDERMILAYNKGEDLHALTASLISGTDISEITPHQRQAAKAVNFGLVFGMGAEGLKAYSCETYGVDMTIDEANLFKKRFFDGYKGIENWHKNIKQSSSSTSHTLSGRKHVYGDDAGLSGRYNTPVQGTAADIIKNALGMLHLRLEEPDAKIVAVIHDEIVLECDENIAVRTATLLKNTMEEAGMKYIKDLPIVAEANIADSWAEK